MVLGHRFPETLLHFHRVRTFLPRMSTHNASRNGRPRFEHTPREGKSLLDKHETAIETFEGNAIDQRSALHSFITFDDSSFHTNYVFCFLVRSFPIIISISWPLLFDLQFLTIFDLLWSRFYLFIFLNHLVFCIK